MALHMHTYAAAVEQVNVPLSDPNSRLVQAEINFPLGLVIERVDDEAVVTEVSAGSAAEAAGCCVGDVVRATSAMTMQMVYPTMNIMFGGVGRPALVKILVPTAKAPFPKVLDAVRSNSTAQGGDGSITLVLERRDGSRPAEAAAAAAADSSSSSSEESVVGEAGADEDASAFDPKIFE
ncbi:hypothetical protein OEZ85_004235 [Tetradesmus obliquus]|uniref:PDZ domain-containing protein n=1 Tax=Tetradesmus obliquus TaxID=3088 RepID=A0ABY8ULE7_TETOB|nr:hypothetical protein OEZ85_004235 [Tetradesmus obliquus]